MTDSKCSHIDRTGLYIMVIILLFNTCGLEDEHRAIKAMLQNQEQAPEDSQ